MAMVQINNVTKRFGKLTAIDKVNFKLDEGEILGFIGPNGAGKTTLIRVLMGILQATEGSCSIFGKDVWRDAVDIHRRIAYVPGDVNLWPNLTGGEVIDLFVRLRKGVQKRYQKELLERFDLDPSKKCRTYSKGNRQKVALVAAFASDVDLYILDEPTSGLDPLMEGIFQECVKEVKAAGKSVLLSSHILSEVEELCDKVNIIRQGKIIEAGTLNELRHLTRTDIIVQTSRPLEGLESNPNIHNIKQMPTGLFFTVDTEVLGAVIADISRHDIISLQCMPPTLEQLFISHYAERG